MCGFLLKMVLKNLTFWEPVLIFRSKTQTLYIGVFWYTVAYVILWIVNFCCNHLIFSSVFLPPCLIRMCPCLPTKLPMGFCSDWQFSFQSFQKWTLYPKNFEAVQECSNSYIDDADVDVCVYVYVREVVVYGGWWYVCIDCKHECVCGVRQLNPSSTFSQLTASQMSLYMNNIPSSYLKSYLSLPKCRDHNQLINHVWSTPIEIFWKQICNKR